MDIEHDSNNAIQDNGQTLKQNIVNEISEEKQLILARVEAEMNGNDAEVHIINAKLFALKNKRISELENEVKTITTNSLDIIESRKVINRLVREIAFKEYNSKFGACWNELYSKVNYKLNINVKARQKKPMDSFSEEEMYEVEKIVRTWANQIGINVDNVLTLRR